MGDLKPGDRFGAYVVEGFIAGGGMGRVYAAKHDVYPQPAALKLLHDRFAGDARWHRRFSEEGLIGMQLKHPCVLSARELIDQDGQLALVMDLVRGGQTLLSVIEREHPAGLSLADALAVFLQVLSGVEYLHERGIVHGDLKPENVLIAGSARDPASWRPQVTDFGTVALIADPVVIDGKSAVVASPRYASPEHLLGSDHLEVRSDVHALGLLLHWLVTGEHLSGARDVEEARETLAKRLSMVQLVDQPDAVRAVVRKAIEADPEARYADCRGLALAIRDVLDELGVHLDVEDLKSELATEILEERAAAQRALQRGDGPAPSAEDTELNLEDVGEDEEQDEDDAADEPKEPAAAEPEAAAEEPVAAEEPAATEEPVAAEAPAATKDPEPVAERAERAERAEADIEPSATPPRSTETDPVTPEPAPADKTPEPAIPLVNLILGTLGCGTVLGLLTALAAWLLGFVG